MMLQNKDFYRTLGNAIMAYNSVIATEGSWVGLILTAPAFAIDLTVGMDNFLRAQSNYYSNVGNEISKGNYGAIYCLSGHHF